jgi:hypothetical protein
MVEWFDGSMVGYQAVETLREQNALRAVCLDAQMAEEEGSPMVRSLDSLTLGCLDAQMVCRLQFGYTVA